jgi:uncharacterized iron-regulated membrane protein
MILLVLVLLVSGIYLVFPNAVIALVGAEPFPAGVHSTPAGGAQPMSVGAAVAIAKRRFPDAAFGFVTIPEGPDGVYRVVLRQPGEVRRTGGSTSVWLDQYSGAILKVRDPRRFGAANAFIDGQFPLHNGEALGMSGRLVVFVCGIIPAVLYVTGFLLWFRKRGQS